MSTAYLAIHPPYRHMAVCTWSTYALLRAPLYCLSSLGPWRGLLRVASRGSAGNGGDRPVPGFSLERSDPLETRKGLPAPPRAAFDPRGCQIGVTTLRPD